jgi:acetyl esterase/lipase
LEAVRRSGRLCPATLGLALVILLVLPAGVFALPTPVLNVPYGPEEKQVSDIYPAQSPGSVIVVMVHAGGWKSGDKKSLTARSRELQREGFAVFNVDYRLDSKTVRAFPMEVEDIESATSYAIAHAGEYQAGPGNIVLIGGSAGGHLVAAAAEGLNAREAGSVTGVVALSGAYDLPLMISDFREGKLPASLATDVKWAIGCTTVSSCETPEKEAFAEQWSPADQFPQPCVPWLILNGDHEVMPVDQAQAMTATLEQSACPVTETLVATEKHAFAYWALVREQIVAFVRAN